MFESAWSYFAVGSTCVYAFLYVSVSLHVITKINILRQCFISEYIGWSDIAVIHGHITISVLWGKTANCVKLSGENLSRYLNEIVSVGLRKCPYYPYYHYLTKVVKKLMSQ